MPLEATQKALVMVMYGGSRQRAFLRLFRGEPPSQRFHPLSGRRLAGRKSQRRRRKPLCALTPGGWSPMFRGPDPETRRKAPAVKRSGGAFPRVGDRLARLSTGSPPESGDKGKLGIGLGSTKARARSAGESDPSLFIPARVREQGSDQPRRPSQDKLAQNVYKHHTCENAFGFLFRGVYFGSMWPWCQM